MGTGMNDRRGLWTGFILGVCALSAPSMAQEPAPQPPSEPAPSEPSPQPPEPPPAEPPAPTTPPAPPPQQPEPEAQPTGGAEDPEPETVVVLKDGQRFTGFLVERTPERVVLRIAGINTPIKRGVIDRVEIMPPVRERYQRMRELIDDTDAESLLRLAEWLRVRGEWDLALKEVDQALAVKPNDPDALRLKQLVQSQKELAEKPRVPGAPSGGAPQNGGAGAQDVDNFPLLSPKDINTIKVYEVDLKNPPRMVIKRETIDAFLEKYRGDNRVPQTPEEQSALYRASPTKVLDLMFRLRAREFYPEVQVVDLPRSLRAFRDDVHRTWLLNSCATNSCHGGNEAGRLRLYNKRPNTEETVFTNFVILERYRLPDGSPLINYQEPGRSPLLQMGLPRNESKHPHPVVPGREARGDLWRPFFRSGEADMRFEQAVAWIQSMYRPRPDYPIEYKPPTPEAIAPPADAPPVER